MSGALRTGTISVRPWCLCAPSTTKAPSAKAAAGRKYMRWRTDTDQWHLKPTGTFESDNDDDDASFFVLKAENLEEDLRALSILLCRDRSFCDPLPPLPRVNAADADERPKSAEPRARPVWSAAARRLVRRFYNADLRLGGYAAEPPA